MAPELIVQVIELMELKRREGYVFTKEEDANYKYLCELAYPAAAFRKQVFELSIIPELIVALLKLKREGDQTAVTNDPTNLIEAYAKHKNITVDTCTPVIGIDEQAIEVLVRMAVEHEDFDPNHFLDHLITFIPNDLGSLVERNFSSRR